MVLFKQNHDIFDKINTNYTHLHILYNYKTEFSPLMYPLSNTELSCLKTIWLIWYIGYIAESFLSVRIHGPKRWSAQTSETGENIEKIAMTRTGWNLKRWPGRILTVVRRYFRTYESQNITHSKIRINSIENSARNRTFIIECFQLVLFSTFLNISRRASCFNKKGRD